MTETLKAPKSFHDIANNTEVPDFLHHVELPPPNTPEQPRGALKLAYTAPHSASLQATSSHFIGKLRAAGVGIPASL